MKRQTTIVIGIVLLIIGSAGIVFSIGSAWDAAGDLPDPENDAVETLNFDGAGSQDVTLEEDEYEIWAERADTCKSFLWDKDEDTNY